MLAEEEPALAQRVVMSGDEAVARGAAEADVRFAASYPGTSALARYGKEFGFHVEWSANEKVAFEAAYAASLAGQRSLVGTKHLGMNVLSDSLLVGAYGGVRGGLVVAVRTTRIRSVRRTPWTLDTMRCLLGFLALSRLHPRKRRTS